MPRGDRTGPDGQGPRTGRGLGNCGTSDKPTTPRRGCGRGRGNGRRFRGRE